MKPDGTNSFSAAAENIHSPMGNRLTEPEIGSGLGVRTCHLPDYTMWSYVFVRHSRVKQFEDRLQKDNRPFFVHRTVRFFKKKNGKKIQPLSLPTISGFIFFQGSSPNIQAYLDRCFPHTYLCKNCSTGKVTEISDSQMRPFMCLNATDPERIRFLLRPFHYYACNRILLRISSGELVGIEGYVIRIDRDRHLVIDVGGISVSIAGVHTKKFEEVGQCHPTTANHNIFCHRNLQERQALIDRYFQPVRTMSEVVAQAENINYLREYVLSELCRGRMKISEAWNIYVFIIEEIGYYYASFAEQVKENFAPILDMGRKVLFEMKNRINDPRVVREVKE